MPALDVQYRLDHVTGRILDQQGRTYSVHRDGVIAGLVEALERLVEATARDEVLSRCTSLRDRAKSALDAYHESIGLAALENADSA